MKTMLSMPRTSSRTVNVSSPIHAFGSLIQSMNVQSTAVGRVAHGLTLTIVSTRAAACGNFRQPYRHSRLTFESNSARHCIQSANQIAVASDGFNGTLLTSLLLLYEYALSFLFSLDHDPRLLVDDCSGAKLAEHDAAIAFSDNQ